MYNVDNMMIVKKVFFQKSVLRMDIKKIFLNSPIGLVFSQKSFYTKNGTKPYILHILKIPYPNPK